MITKLRAENFKSWKDTGELRLAPLTGLFGTNSSGKTSILQVLLLLKQTVERPSDWADVLDFGDAESLVDLGTFDDIIHEHRLDSKLNLSVSWKLPQKMSVESSQGQGNVSIEIDALSFLTSIVKDEHRVALDRFRYTADRHHFGMALNSKGQYRLEPANKGKSVPSPFRCYGLKSGANEAYQTLFSQLKKAFEELFSRIEYLGPLRQYPQRRYTWQGEHPPGVGYQGQQAIPALLAGRVQLLTSKSGGERRSIDERILDWLQTMELIHSYTLQPVRDKEKDYEFCVKMRMGGPEVQMADIGFGVSQILPVLILCYYVPEGSILILEQPEVHLHPKVQADLADVFIDVVKERNVQIILESHSEHLLRRLQQRIAEEQISADKTALYFCRIEEGTSAIEQLDVDEYGNIRNWPQGFFGDEMGDLAAKTIAEMKRRKVSEQ
ncbi:DUF3696 domain-containing protein [Candidatus Poribacteria bacterium]|nr:DUF3696 domain-containing protein [Candidatus Poribacteria bacterium]